ncbi:MAG: hypothetical protein JSV56_00140 [Methanomassiliicoccales archaeon]|nr:MAG: hypothetical protein JSV56_00140 [Methanomassiliicoccales archaeon]
MYEEYDNRPDETMDEKGRLLYEEDIKKRRAQAELNPYHIFIVVSLLFLILTWAVFGVIAWRGTALSWLAAGLLISIIITLILIYIIDELLRLELTKYIPIKVYEKGILMPTTPIDRIFWRKKPFIHASELSSIRLIRAHKPEQKDCLIATTVGNKNYPKRYDRNSKEVPQILDVVKRTFSQVKVDISE